VAAHAFQPAGDGGITASGEAHHDRHIDPFGQKPQHHLDAIRTGFQVVQRCADAGGKHLAARLTLETLDAIVPAVTDQCMDSIIRDAYEALQRQVHKTVGTLVHFRASSDDAEVAIKDLFSFDADTIKYMRHNWQKPFGMDVLYEEPVFYDLSEKYEVARAGLLELDRAIEHNPRFAREKVRPGVAYLHSRAYELRFGVKSGRWLVVTTGKRRMLNMKRQTETAAGDKASLFYFTVLADVTPETVLTAPIWWRGGSEQPTTLFEEF
jgi:hypothetical protein